MADKQEMGERYRCFEHGSAVQAAIFWAGEFTESLARRREESDRTVEVGTGLSREEAEYELRASERIGRDAREALSVAKAALENAVSCGVLDKVGGVSFDEAVSRWESRVHDGDFSAALAVLDTLRARLRHPQRYMEYGR